MSNIGGSLKDLIVGDNPAPAVQAAWKRLEAAEAELVAACRELMRITEEPVRRPSGGVTRREPPTGPFMRAKGLEPPRP